MEPLEHGVGALVVLGEHVAVGADAVLAVADVHHGAVFEEQGADLALLVVLAFGGDERRLGRAGVQHDRSDYEPLLVFEVIGDAGLVRLVNRAVAVGLLAERVPHFGALHGLQQRVG